MAAVVAESESAAAQALELIEIAYEELPAVTTLEEALASGAPLVHTAEPLAGHFADLSILKPRPGTNICHQFHLERGKARMPSRGPTSSWRMSTLSRACSTIPWSLTRRSRLGTNRAP